MDPKTDLHVLLIKIGTEPGLESIPTKLRQIDSRIKTFGVLGRPTDRHDFDVVVSSSYEAMLAAHPEVVRDGLYVRPELYEKIAAAEGQIIRMYDRVAISDLSLFAHPDVPIPRFRDSVDDRMQLFLRQAAYWDFAFSHHQIDAVVAQNYGHNGYDAVLHAVAIARKIPYMFFHEVRPFLRSTHMYESITELGHNEFGKRLISIARERKTYVEDSDSRRVFMERQVGLIEDEMQIANIVSSDKRQKVFRRVGNPRTLPRRLTRSIRRRKRNRKSMRDERNAISTAPLPENFVFCELQSQPNATTALKGWMYPDQRESLAMIARHLPVGWKLVAKESDRQWSRMYPRRDNFWSQIAAVPGIHVVSSDSDAVALMRKSKGLVETSYSTLAFRAIKEGIPVMILGHSHIRQIPGVKMIDSDEAAAGVLGTLCEARNSLFGGSASESSIKAFLESEIQSTLEGALSYVPRMDSDSNQSRYLHRITNNAAAVIAAWLSHLESSHQQLGIESVPSTRSPDL